MKEPKVENYVGHRAKIGVIIPSTNTSVEYDCQRILPRGVSWHTARFFIEHPDLSTDDNFITFLELLRKEIPVSLRDVMTCNVDHIMMGMSAETFWGGVEGNDAFIKRIQDQVGNIQLTTGANAVIAALKAYGGIRTVSVVTPYQPIGDKNVIRFFEESGYQVKRVVGLRAENAHDAIAKTPESAVCKIVKDIDGDDVDAIIQVGTNLSTLGLFPTLEKFLGKPCLPINVATVWHALRSVGIKDKFDNMGRLLEEH